MSPLPEPPSNGSPSAEEDSSQSRAQFESKYPTFFSLQVNFQRFLLFFKATAIIESVENLQPRTRSSIVDISDQV